MCQARRLGKTTGAGYMKIRPRKEQLIIGGRKRENVNLYKNLSPTTLLHAITIRCAFMMQISWLNEFDDYSEFIELFLSKYALSFIM